MDMKKIAVMIAALLASVSVSACPLSECMPELAGSNEDKAYVVAMGKDWFERMQNLKDPVQAMQHTALIASRLQVAMIQAENRALHRALETGKEPDFTSMRQLPSYQSLHDAIASDVLQVLTTGRMPQLERLDQRIQASVLRSVIEEAGEELGQPRKPRRIIE